MSKIYLYDEENSDKYIQKSVLLHVLDFSFRLLHPIMPFITEKLWQLLPDAFKTYPTIMYASWPKPQKKYSNKPAERAFVVMADLVKEIRKVKHDFGIPLKTKVPLKIEGKEIKQIFKLCNHEFIKMANIDEEKFVISPSIEPPPKSACIVLKNMNAYVPLAGMIDIEKEKLRINKAIEKKNKHIQKITQKLSGDFAARAPPDLVEKEKVKLEELKVQSTHLKDQLAILE